MGELITIPTFRIEEAKWAAQEVERNLPDVPNYTGISADNRYYIGYRGEFALLELFRSKGKWVTYSMQLHGKSDGAEFLLNMKDGSVRSLDTKTGGALFHRWNMIPIQQHARYKCDYYVGVRLNTEDQAEIFGTCLHSDYRFEHCWENTPETVAPVLLYPYDKHRPISELLDLVEDGPTMIIYPREGLDELSTHKHKHRGAGEGSLGAQAAA